MITHREIVWRFVEPKIKELGIKGKVLDVGCCDDSFKKRFEDLGLNWTGCDINPMSDDVRFSNMNSIWTGDEVYDLVFCCHALEHDETPIQALREFRRVVKKEGFVIVVTPWPCKHHILESDFDHVFVLNAEQLAKLFRYTFYSFVGVFMQQEGIEKEQDYNIIVVARK